MRAASGDASRRERLVVKAGGAIVAAIVLGAAARQAFVLAKMLAEFSGYLGESPIRMGLALVPHAAIELSAMFLPLGAILVERRSGEEAMRARARDLGRDRDPAADARRRDRGLRLAEGDGGSDLPLPRPAGRRPAASCLSGQ